MWKPCCRTFANPQRPEEVFGDGVQDAESGWSSLHRALHFGHLAAAGVLLEGGASLAVEDTKGRTPVDLIAGPLAPLVGEEGRSTCGPAPLSATWR